MLEWCFSRNLPHLKCCFGWAVETIFFKIWNKFILESVSPPFWPWSVHEGHGLSGISQRQNAWQHIPCPAEWSWQERETERESVTEWESKSERSLQIFISGYSISYCIYTYIALTKSVPSVYSWQLSFIYHKLIRYITVLHTALAVRNVHKVQAAVAPPHSSHCRDRVVDAGDRQHVGDGGHPPPFIWDLEKEWVLRDKRREIERP